MGLKFIFGKTPGVELPPVYVILCNEQGKTASQVWDGRNMKLTFRRNFSAPLMIKWHELEGVAFSLSLYEETDALIWQYENKGEYSTSSLYAIINFGGVTPVFILAVWQLVIPPRVHIFLWLLSQNKPMTRDKLKKRNMNKPE
jgi:hypothetical protein